jgi:hypothetical protein
MIRSAAEIDGIVREAAEGGATLPRSRSATDIRRLLMALPDFEFQTARAPPLQKLCAAGAHYGWRELEKNTPADLLANLSARAKASVRRNLQRDLEWLTRPCLELEWTSFGLAMTSIGLPAGQRDPGEVRRIFLRDRPSYRLFSLFQRFPVLAHLWSLVIRQWRAHVKEVLLRFAQDRGALSRRFFSNRPIPQILDAHFGLSDRHHAGRTVVRLQLEDRSIIYKPRTGAGEMEWFSFLGWMNRRGFQPNLRTARVLPRRNYCWMEYVESGALTTEAAARRFYERMGGIIAAAYLLKAVDCHRDNLIAAGEHPVLVDADALWHVSPLTRVHSLTDLLDRTGFFPNANPRSLQSQSSVLGPGRAGKHVPRLHGRPLKPGRHKREMARGFARAWKCILGTPSARQGFARRLHRIRLIERRWLYRATETYAAIREASIQPPALRSLQDRELLIRDQCRRNGVASPVIEGEVRALKQLDIPCFVARTSRLFRPIDLPFPKGSAKPSRRTTECS